MNKEENLEVFGYMLEPEPGSTTRFRSPCCTVSACVLPSECHVHVPLLNIDARASSLHVAEARALSQVRRAAETCSEILKKYAEGPS